MDDVLMPFYLVLPKGKKKFYGGIEGYDCGVVVESAINIQDLVPCQPEGYNGRLCRRQDCAVLSLIIVAPKYHQMYRRSLLTQGR